MKDVILKIAEEIKNVIKLTSDEVYQQRIKICEGCEFLNKDLYRCGKCGCFVQIKAKIFASKCPIKKWPDEKTPPSTCGC